MQKAVFLLFFLPFALFSRDLRQTLDSLVPSLLESRKVQGAQIAVFKPGKVLLGSYGKRSADGAAVDNATVFQAGQLIQPVVASIAIQRACQINATECDVDLTSFIKEEYGVFPRGNVKLSHLLSMSAGLSASHRGLLSPNEADPSKSFNRKSYLKENLVFEEKPGIRTAASSESYEIVSLWLEKENINLSTVVQYGSIDSPEKANKATGYNAAQHWPMPVQDIRFIYRSYHSLYTTAADYAKFLQELPGQNGPGDRFLSTIYNNQNLPGGMGPGFQAVKLCSDFQPGSLYVNYSEVAGFRSVAVISQDGRGMVVFLNGEDVILLSAVFQRIFKDVFFECPGFFEKEVIPETDTLSEAEGIYRPVAGLPRAQRFFSFMLDNRLRRNAEGYYEFAGFFEKDPSIFFKPAPINDQPFYRAVGLAPMAGTSFKIEKTDDGQVKALVSDTLIYEKIHILESVWGRIVLASAAIVCVFILILVFLIKR